MTSTTLPTDFLALRTHSVDGRIDSRLERLNLDDLSAGEVLVRVRHAGINYKDCLSLLGQAKIITAFPRIAGIELVGEVLASTDASVAIGQTALVHGLQTGIATDGGFAEVARVPAAHLQPLPAGLSALDAAVLGVPIWVWAGSRFSKHNALIFAVVSSLVALIRIACVLPRCVTRMCDRIVVIGMTEPRSPRLSSRP